MEGTRLLIDMISCGDPFARIPSVDRHILDFYSTRVETGVQHSSVNSVNRPNQISTGIACPRPPADLVLIREKKRQGHIHPRTRTTRSGQASAQTRERIKWGWFPSGLVRPLRAHRPGLSWVEVDPSAKIPKSPKEIKRLTLRASPFASPGLARWRGPIHPISVSA